jgi:hypothetical protein
MTQPTRIYKHSSAGTDWAALALGAGLGLTLALQLMTVRLSDFNTFYSLVVSLSRAKWFGQPELQGYQVFGVTRHEESAWEI